MGMKEKDDEEKERDDQKSGVNEMAGSGEDKRRGKKGDRVLKLIRERNQSPAMETCSVGRGHPNRERSEVREQRDVL